MNNKDHGRTYQEHNYFKAFSRVLGLEGSLRFLRFYEKWYVASPAAARKAVIIIKEMTIKKFGIVWQK